MHGFGRVSAERDALSKAAIAPEPCFCQSVLCTQKAAVGFSSRWRISFTARAGGLVAKRRGRRAQGGRCCLQGPHWRKARTGGRQQFAATRQHIRVFCVHRESRCASRVRLPCQPARSPASPSGDSTVQYFGAPQKVAGCNPLLRHRHADTQRHMIGILTVSALPRRCARRVGRHGRISPQRFGHVSTLRFSFLCVGLSVTDSDAALSRGRRPCL